jgi:hypothetical protein
VSRSIHVPSPFGTGCDEQAETDAFERLCGGVKRAQRMLYLWNDSYPAGSEYDRMMGRGASKAEVFKAKAKREGFTDEQIAAFMHL